MQTQQYEKRGYDSIESGLSFRELARDMWRRSKETELQALAAAVSYYSILASIPFLALLMTLAAQLLPTIAPGTGPNSGTANVTAHELNRALSMILPPQAREGVTQEVMRIQTDPPVALLSIGIVLALWTISNAFMAVISAMNRIYEFEETRAAWKLRLRALSLPLIMSFVLIAALVCIIALPVAINLFRLDAFAGTLIALGQWLAVYCCLLLSFGFIYRLAPNHPTKAKLISPGSLVGAAVLLIGSVLFQTYVANFGSYQKIYGSFGGAIVFLIWCWLANACLLFGCILNKALQDQNKPGGFAENVGSRLQSHLPD
jgi:membrane protein